MFNNNRDGTFADVAKDLGLGLAETPVAAVVCDDFDNDRDLDLLFFFAGDQPPVAWVNDRVGSYHLLDAAATGLRGRTRAERHVGRSDKDGDRDLLVFTEQGLRLYVNRGGFRFEEHPGFARRHRTDWAAPAASSSTSTTTATWTS